MIRLLQRPHRALSCTQTSESGRPSARRPGSYPAHASGIVVALIPREAGQGRPVDAQGLPDGAPAVWAAPHRRAHHCNGKMGGQID